MHAGLINSEEPKFVEGLVATAAGSVSQALADADRTRFSALLRFLAALVPANVLHPSAVIGQLQRIVDVALEVAKTGTPLSLGSTCMLPARLVIGRTKPWTMCRQVASCNSLLCMSLGLYSIAGLCPASMVSLLQWSSMSLGSLDGSLTSIPAHLA